MTADFDLTSMIVGPLHAEPALAVGFGAIVIAFGYASFGAIYTKLYPERMDRPVLTLSKTLVFLWLMAVVCLAAWLVSGRGLMTLGLDLGEGWRALLAWGLALAASVYALGSAYAGTSSAQGRETYAANIDQSPGLQAVIPRTRIELVLFCAVAVTAGITEEIIFRGFVLEGLGLALPVWGAALASGVIFIGFHAYQGLAGMVRIAPITIILTALVLLGETLWPAIILHICVDLSAAILFWRCKGLLTPVPQRATVR